MSLRSLAFAILLLPSIGRGQSGNLDNTPIKVKPTVDFEVTGKGKASAWSDADWIPLPCRLGPACTHETRFKILYSSTGLYCLFDCADHRITSTLKADFADLFNEDVVEAFFWPNDSVPIYFEYELSPNNYELPILVPNFRGNFLGWRPWHYDSARLTRHATSLTKDNQRINWTAEFFIPFALLKPLLAVNPMRGTLWRANFYRLDYDDGLTEWSWRLTRTNFHDYKRFGTLQFD